MSWKALIPLQAKISVDLSNAETEAVELVLVTLAAELRFSIRPRRSA